MNRPIRRVAFVAMVMFALLFANGTYMVLFRESALEAQPQNRRVRDAEFAQDRGAILAAGKTEMATTVPVKNGFRFLRTYAAGKLYAPVTGFYSYDHARSGLENTYNTELAGTDAALFVRRLIDLAIDRTPQGATVETTLLPAAQRAAAQGLGDNKGAVVALDPQTGAVLALVTSPSYDPNDIATHDIVAADKAYRRLARDPDRPMANRAAREIYPPGSTFKLVTAAAALAEGLTPESKVKSPNRLRLPATNTFLGNSSSCGGATTTLRRALEISCNTAFATVGINLGQEKLRSQAELFGFGARHLDDLGGVPSQFPADLNDAQLALSAIGQFDVAASPLQMAMVTAGIANDGLVMEPYVVSQVRGPDLRSIQSHRPRELSAAMTTENAAQLQKMMVSVVENGTGRRGAIPGIGVGGKTGTAQSDPKRKPFAWYTSFAPEDNPSVAVAVVVEDANIPRQEIAGSRVAAPIARAVMQAVLDT